MEYVRHYFLGNGKPIPEGDILKAELCARGEAILKVHERDCLIGRLTLAIDFEHAVQIAKRAMILDQLSWKWEMSERGAIDAEIRQAPPWQKLTRSMLPELLELYVKHDRRLIRTQLRILRVAVGYKATGKLLALEDPCGGMLLHSEKDQSLLIRSAGAENNNVGSHGNRVHGRRLAIDIPR